MNIAQTEKFLFNPLFTSKLLLMALAGADNKKLKMELTYYILPLIYNDTIKDKLVRSTAKSTFKTFLNTEVKKELIVNTLSLLVQKVPAKSKMYQLLIMYSKII